MKLFTPFCLFAVIGILQSVENEPHLLKSSSPDLYQAVQPVQEFSKEEKDREKLLMLMAGEWITRGIYTAAKLDIASMLDEGPKTIHEIALRTQTHKDSLERLLRLLTSIGLFKDKKKEACRFS